MLPMKIVIKQAPGSAGIIPAGQSGDLEHAGRDAGAPRRALESAMKLILKSVICFLALVASYAANATALDTSFDAAPFALPLPEGNGLLWEDPREIHRVVVH